MSNFDTDIGTELEKTTDVDAVVPKPMRFWQVQHGQTWREAESMGRLWSPKTKANGNANPWYQTMKQVSIGDRIFSYRDGMIQSIGLVKEPAISSASPFANADPAIAGWLLKVEFTELINPFKLEDHYNLLSDVMTKMDENSIRPPGKMIIQGYLKEISRGVAEIYENLGGNVIVETTSEDNEGNMNPDTDLFKQLAEDLTLQPSFLSEINELLEDKGQVIFYGPPGAGKTYVALKIADFLSGGNASNDLVELVQFHASYAYEDFVEGFRPVEDGTFKIAQGKLLAIAERAESNPGKKYFLIIDEINRGNLSKIFGEMYFLLEYRDQEIQLQYSDKSFKMPKNLYFIGTMNSADRSVGLIDSALRRRFHFVSFYPTADEMKDLLRNWLTKNAPDMEWLADVVDNANKKLQNPDFAIGPSHFMKLGIDESLATKIWNRSILPYVEDFYFNRKEDVKEFELDRLRALKRLPSPDVELPEGNGAEAQAS